MRRRRIPDESKIYERRVAEFGEQEGLQIKSCEKIRALVKWISEFDEPESKFQCGLEFRDLSPGALCHVAYLINSTRTNNSSILQL